MPPSNTFMTLECSLLPAEHNCWESAQFTRRIYSPPVRSSKGTTDLAGRLKTAGHSLWPSSLHVCWSPRLHALMHFISPSVSSTLIVCKVVGEKNPASKPIKWFLYDINHPNWWIITKRNINLVVFSQPSHERTVNPVEGGNEQEWTGMAVKFGHEKSAPHGFMQWLGTSSIVQPFNVLWLLKWKDARASNH